MNINFIAGIGKAIYLISLKCNIFDILFDLLIHFLGTNQLIALLVDLNLNIKYMGLVGYEH